MARRRGQRRREQVSLAEPAAQREQGVALLGPFDALGDHVEAERLGHRQDREHDAAIGALVRDAADERPVDLQALGRELLEIGQVRVRAAEVVQREMDAAGAEVLGRPR